MTEFSVKASTAEKLPFTADQIKALIGFLAIVLQYWLFRAMYTMGARSKFLTKEKLQMFSKQHH